MAKKREHSPTSKAAEISMEGAPKEVQYEKIKEGLKKLKVGGNYESIAHASGLEPVAVGRRLSEMKDLNLVYPCGYTKKTSKNREAVVWQLIGLGYKNEDGISIVKKKEIEKKEKAELPPVQKIKKQIDLF